MTTPASNPKPIHESAPGKQLYADGFLAIRNGLFDHLNQGLLPPNELAVYLLILHQCDWSSGLWNGTAYRIEFGLGKTISIPQIQRAIRALEKKKYVKSYHKKGYRGNYFIAIHKYCVSVGDLRGKYLNALKSETYKGLVYDEKCDKDVIATSGASDAYVRAISSECDPSLYQEYKTSRSKEMQESNPPTIQDTRTDGRTASSETSLEAEPLRASEDPAEAWGQWLSDLWQAKSGLRYVPANEDIRRIESILSEEDPVLLAVAGYQFCNRPQGFGGLSDAFGAFWKSAKSLKKDASDHLLDFTNPQEALTDLHESLFPLENAARERGRKMASMECLDAVLGLLGLKDNAVLSSNLCGRIHDADTEEIDAQM